MRACNCGRPHGPRGAARGSSVRAARRSAKAAAAMAVRVELAQLRARLERLRASAGGEAEELAAQFDKLVALIMERLVLLEQVARQRRASSPTCESTPQSKSKLDRQGGAASTETEILTAQIDRQEALFRKRLALLEQTAQRKQMVGASVGGQTSRAARPAPQTETGQCAVATQPDAASALPAERSWLCGVCTRSNAGDAAVCRVCSARRGRKVRTKQTMEIRRRHSESATHTAPGRPPLGAQRPGCIDDTRPADSLPLNSDLGS